MLPYGRQHITEEDIEAVVSVLRSDYLTQGPLVPIFESFMADYCKANYAIATNSATSALHIACLALGLGPGDYLWTSPISFVASANCAIYCGANVDFVDINPLTYNMSIQALEDKLKEAERNRRLPKIIIPVHLAGEPAEMEEIHKLALRYKFKIIEDASHAVGAKYRNEPVGGCKYSDITVFSFHPVKIITSGEGGMAMTNQKDLFDKMSLLRSHGVMKDPLGMTKVSDGDWYYQQLGIGFNYRMSELHAALGISQAKRIDSYVQIREKIAQRYSNLLKDLPIILPFRGGNGISSNHLYIIRIDASKTNKTRKELFDSLRKDGLGVNVHYIPIHLQPYYEAMGFRAGSFARAEFYYSTALSIPIFPTMSQKDQEQVASSLIRFFLR